MRYPRNLSKLVKAENLNSAINFVLENHLCAPLSGKNPHLFFDRKRKALLLVSNLLYKQKHLSIFDLINIYAQNYAYLLKDAVEFFFSDSVEIYDFNFSVKTHEAKKLYVTINNIRDMEFFKFDHSSDYTISPLHKINCKLGLFLKLKILSQSLKHFSTSYAPIAQRIHFETKNVWNQIDEILVDEGVNTPSYCLLSIAKEKDIYKSIHVYSPFTYLPPIQTDKIYVRDPLLAELHKNSGSTIVKIPPELNSLKSVHVQKEKGERTNIGLAVGSDLVDDFQSLRAKIILFVKNLNNEIAGGLDFTLSLHPQYRDTNEENKFISFLIGKRINYRREKSDIGFLSKIDVLVSERSTLVIFALQLGKPTVMITPTPLGEAEKLLKERYQRDINLVSNMREAEQALKNMF